MYPSTMSASDEDGTTELDMLRQEHPGWRFGSVWASAASGPDARRIYATRDGRLITA